MRTQDACRLLPICRSSWKYNYLAKGEPAFIVQDYIKIDEMNPGAGQEPAAHPEEEKPPMFMKDDTEGRDIDAVDKRHADILWKILWVTRFAIPLYVFYALYLWWTLPPSAYLMTGN